MTGNVFSAVCRHDQIEVARGDLAHRPRDVVQLGQRLGCSATKYLSHILTEYLSHFVTKNLPTPRGAFIDGPLRGDRLMSHFARWAESMSKVEIEDKIRGDDLIARYNATLNPAISGAVPSLLLAWQALSENMHARKGDGADFSRLHKEVCDHIERIEILGSTALAPQPE